MKNLRLIDGNEIPQLGIGTWQVDDAAAEQQVRSAIEIGYRLIDTAKLYGNEAGVGRAIRTAGTPRSQLFITTKMWHDDAGYDSALRAFDRSMGLLGLDYLDLYLIHWPTAAADVDSWRAFVRLQEEGRVRSIGVSNFDAAEIDRVFNATGVMPSVNQIELHPEKPAREMREANAERKIITQSWGPLGRGAHRGGSLTSPVVVDIAEKHARTPAQIILRWHIQLGLVAIPKTVHVDRMKENLDVLGFELDEHDMGKVGSLG
jgi:2,5-diketo-D-gluconate reductase A